MAKKKATGFSVRLRELRTAAGLTQAELADRAQMHLHGLTKLEQGDREPSWATVQALAKALGVSCEAFQAEDDEAPAEDVGQEGKEAKDKPGKRRTKKGKGE